MPGVVTVLIEHLHCLDERDLHPRERVGQHADLVLAPRLEFAGVEIAEAHLVGNRRQARHAPDHHHVQHHVQQHERRQEHDASDSMNVRNVSFARRIGTDIGTETTCAPITSWNFHPKPLALP